MRIEFRLLGPVSVLIDGEPVPLGPRQQALLAVLLVEPNQLVSRDQLLDRVWGDKQPIRPANAMQTQLTLLRRAIPDVAIVWRNGGYQLVVDESAIDLDRFRDLVAQARAVPPDQAVARWDEALALWRGEPCTGIALPWFARLRTALLAERYAAQLDRTDVLLQLGRHDLVLPELTSQAQDQPLDERVAGQLMLALHRAGRTAEALAHYMRVRERLADELGADPSLSLRAVHQQLLGTPDEVRPAPVPRQLPAAPGSFTGRARELATLTRILDSVPEHGGTLVISATSGTGGIGKTWLSLHWAHQYADRFPDGQLFVDLRGFSPEARPLDPATAIRGFLDALGVDPANIPTSVAAQAALWRTLAADRRLLVLLDNAANAEQVVPLLPGGSSSTVLVNSRDHLTGLITGHGAHPVGLDILTDAEARELLSDRLGAERVAAESDAVDELLALCGGFPLALSIVAGHAQSHPGFPLAALVGELRDNRLAALADDDPAVSLPSVLSWSYAALTDEQARAFRLLGAVSCADIVPAATASLLDRSIQDTRSILRALQRASLLRQDRPGRYGMHDLVRAYAREQSGPEAEPAVRRLVDFVLHTAHAADAVINPPRPRITLAPPVAGACPIRFDDIKSAMRWFTDEFDNVTALHHELAARGWSESVWQLAWASTTYRERTGGLVEDLAVWQTSLASALTLADPAVEVRVRHQLGIAHSRAEQYEQAQAELAEAARLAEDIGDLTMRAFVARSITRAYDLEGRLPEAEAHNKHALVLFERTGNPVWIAGGLNNAGWLAARLGDYEYARSCCDQAIALYRQHQPDDHSGLGHLLDSRGFVATRMGRYEDAIDYYEQARAEYLIAGNVYFDAEALEMLGNTYRALGTLDRARECWQQALQIYRDHQRTVAAQRLAEQLAEIS
ncbi:MAG TPA: BTAD domain-containing putative transcriptional regulator [Pseudonocardiaceae bacterium]